MIHIKNVLMPRTGPTLHENIVINRQIIRSNAVSRHGPVFLELNFLVILKIIHIRNTEILHSLKLTCMYI